MLIITNFEKSSKLVIFGCMDLIDAVALNYYRFFKPSEVKSFLEEFEKGNFDFELPKDLREVGFKELEKAEKSKVRIIPFFDETFPKSLKVIKEKPILLYVKGHFTGFKDESFGIVGSRKSTPYGEGIAYKVSSELSQLGITVVSGLAYGIDSQAHRGALDNGGNTIAVLGNGALVVYPRGNLSLYRRIEEVSFLISEFPLETKPAQYNFPFRNRLISGLSAGVLVVEATEKSGSLITASYAIEQGKEVFALPQNITNPTSRGTNALIKDGAIPFLDVKDILENVRIFNKFLLQYNRDLPFDEDKEMLEKIYDGDTFDTLKEKFQMDEKELISKLTLLEVKGLLKKMGGRYFKV